MLRSLLYVSMYVSLTASAVCSWNTKHPNPRFPRFRITLKHFAKAKNKCSTRIYKAPLLENPGARQLSRLNPNGHWRVAAIPTQIKTTLMTPF